MVRMTIDRAVEILSEASRGVLTNDAEFKTACTMGKEALIGFKGQEHLGVRSGRPSRLEQPR